MTPDALLKDDLVCVFKFDAVDVVTKRKHMGLLQTLVNAMMLTDEYSDPERGTTVSAVSTFYRSNDSNGERSTPVR